METKLVTALVSVGDRYLGRAPEFEAARVVVGYRGHHARHLDELLERVHHEGDLTEEIRTAQATLAQTF